MKKENQGNVPASVRIAFVVFVALGFIITGALWMRGNEIRKENDLLEKQAESIAEENERKKELVSMPMEEYVSENAYDFGYAYPGEERYPVIIEE